MVELSKGVKLDDVRRCWWCGNDPLYVDYHDTEWGRPLHDDQKLFEFLLLEGFQAGLSWITVLRKRENFRKAFKNFDPEKIVRFTETDVARLMSDAGIIRNSQKIRGAITNARAYLELRQSGTSFDQYLWNFTGHQTMRSRHSLSKAKIPTTSPESDAMSKDLKRRGFVFVGSTVCYAHMQACGLVDDHVEDCFRYVPRKRDSRK